MMGSIKYCNVDKARFTTKIHKVKSETVGWLHIFWDQSYVCLHPAPEIIVWRHFCERLRHSSGDIWTGSGGGAPLTAVTIIDGAKFSFFWSDVLSSGNS